LANPRSSRVVPYLVAVIVTVLWSSSYVLIKTGVEEIPPLYFATLRYLLAFGVLATAELLLRRRREASTTVARAPVRTLLLAGICGYTVAQGFQYVGLFFLPAVSTAFILTFSPIFVLVMGIAFVGEGAGRREIMGLLIALVGAFIFFYGRLVFQGEWLGILITIFSGVGWAAYVILARALQKGRSMDSLRLTTLTMGVGVAGLVLLTLLTGRYSPLSPQEIASVVWLATANTAVAFLLWNWALTSIPAYHLTVLQNIMLIEIAILSFAFLGEMLTPLMVLGMALVLFGVILVQLRPLPAQTRRDTSRGGATTQGTSAKSP
jgi:drug/metabolite transporter (DMT)-like permease